MKRATRKLIRDYLVTIIIAVAVAVLIRNFVIEAYRVPSLAMKPTLIAGDTLFVAKWPFEIEKNYSPERGDVVAFSTPSGPEGSSLDYIKRIVGLPGDQVAISKGFLVLNGKKVLSSHSIHDPCPSEQLPNGKSYRICFSAPLLETSGTEKVPENSVFVLGDFRGDLRTLLEKKTRKGWGIIPISSLKGKALWIWLSIDSPSSQSYLPLPHLRWERMFRRIQ